MSSTTNTPALDAKLAAPTQKLSATAATFIPAIRTAQEALLNIVATGCDEFEKEHNRPMTYAEMRAMYG